MACTSFEVDENGIGIFTLQNPPVNAINDEIRCALIDVFTEINAKRIDVRAVIIRSTVEKGFVAGADTKEWYSTDMAMRKRINPTINESCRAIYECNVPVIAAVNGFCIGMGFAYASICDVIVCEEDSWFMFPEVNVGTVGGPAWLTRIFPDKMARYYLMSGKKITAQEMYRLGVVLEVTEKGHVMDAAMRVAKEFAEKYPPTLWCIKYMMNSLEESQMNVVETCAKYRVIGNEIVMGKDTNKREMTNAFNEHRKPVYDLSQMEERRAKIAELRRIDHL